MNPQTELFLPILGTEQPTVAFPVAPAIKHQSPLPALTVKLPCSEPIQSNPTTFPISPESIKRAEKLEKVAASFQKRIDFCFQERLENTRKRISEGEHFRKEGGRLQKRQAMALAIASHLRTGTCPDILQKISTRYQVEQICYWNSARESHQPHGGKPMTDVQISERFNDKQYYKELRDGFGQSDIYGSTKFINALDAAKHLNTSKPDPAEALKHTIRSKENALFGCKIPGFFPTPPNVIKMLESHFPLRADSDFKILEPSAGNGNIADRLRKIYGPAGIIIDCCEIHHSLQEILKAKGHNLVHDDIITFPGISAGCYDLIVMNPPFESGQDCQHVRRCYDFLKPGGTLVSIMAQSWRYNTTQKYLDFRNWFKGRGEAFDIESGAFSKTRISSTGVSATYIVIKKP